MYRFYVGTQAIMDANKYPKALALTEETALATFGGYSHHLVNGGWQNESGTIFREQSLVFELAEATPNMAESFAQYLKAVWHQESILVTYTPTTITFV